MIEATSKVIEEKHEKQIKKHIIKQCRYFTKIEAWYYPEESDIRQAYEDFLHSVDFRKCVIEKM